LFTKISKQFKTRTNFEGYIAHLEGFSNFSAATLFSAESPLPRSRTARSKLNSRRLSLLPEAPMILCRRII